MDGRIRYARRSFAQSVTLCFKASRVFRFRQDTSGPDVEVRLAGGGTPEQGRVEVKTDDGESRRSRNVFATRFRRSIDVRPHESHWQRLNTSELRTYRFQRSSSAITRRARENASPR